MSWLQRASAAAAVGSTKSAATPAVCAAPTSTTAAPSTGQTRMALQSAGGGGNAAVLAAIAAHSAPKDQAPAGGGNAAATAVASVVDTTQAPAGAGAEMGEPTTAKPDPIGEDAEKVFDAALASGQNKWQALATTAIEEPGDTAMLFLQTFAQNDLSTLSAPMKTSGKMIGLIPTPVTKGISLILKGSGALVDYTAAIVHGDEEKAQEVLAHQVPGIVFGMIPGLPSTGLSGLGMNVIKMLASDKVNAEFDEHFDGFGKDRK